MSKIEHSLSTVDAGAKSEKVIYAELTPHEFRKRVAAAPIAYLPLGTLEFHGEHLPLGTDGISLYGFFTLLAQEIGGVVCPMLFLGTDISKDIDGREYYGMDLVGQFDYMPENKRYPVQQLAGSAYWVPDDTFLIILESVLKQLKRAGFEIVVAGGHGPSTNLFRDHKEQWAKKFGFKFLAELTIANDHAATNETSVMMALLPDLVQMDQLPQNLNIWPVAIGTLDEKGDPRKYASSETGWTAIRMEKDRMTKILRDVMRKHY